MNRRYQILILALLVVAAVAAIWSRGGSKETEPAGSDYYTGPRRSKSDPNVWVTADDKIVPPPADAKSLSAGDGGRRLKGGE